MVQWQPYIISIVIGLLIGIEREKSHLTQKTMGVRTFLLISLLGAISGELNNWISFLLAGFTLGLIGVSYYTQTHVSQKNVDRGLTTEFAAGIVFCLGYSSHQNPTLAAIIGPVVAVILFSKKSLHRFINAMSPAEVKSALLLLLGSVVVINLVPNKAIDSFGIFNPQKFGYLVITLASLEFLSYALVKIIGQKKGLLVIGFLGGLVSSTAVLLSSARQAGKASSSWRQLLSSALAAQLAALVEFLLIVGMISPVLLKNLVYTTGFGILWVLAVVIVLMWGQAEHRSSLELKSPLDWQGVFRLSFILAIILILISTAKIFLGDTATFAISFLTGLFELHGLSLATATMFKQGQLSSESASFGILLGVQASLFAKIFMSWFVCRGTFSKALTAILLPLIFAIAVSTWLVFA